MKNISAKAFFQGKEVKRHGDTMYAWDGCKLDMIGIQTMLTDMTDCEDMIKFLQIHKYCLIDNRPKLTPIPGHPGKYFTTTEVNGYTFHFMPHPDFESKFLEPKLITSVDQLIRLSEERKAVIFNGTPPKAASFFIGIPLRTIMFYIKNKMLYEYDKPIA